MLDVETLKSAIEGLAKPAQLDDHPLADAPFVTDYLREHPDKQRLPKGKRLGWALADLWRICCRPSRIVPEDWNEWHTFLSLEVGYFFPFRHSDHFPGKPAQIGRVLAEKEHVAQVIADNDPAQADDLMQKRYDAFWKKILPFGDAATPYSTVRSRLLKALELLLQKLQEEPTPEVSMQSDTEAEAHELPQEPDSAPVITPELVQPAVEVTEPVSTIPSALAAYQISIDRQWPAIVGYRPPVGRYTATGQSREVVGIDEVLSFLEKHQALVITGETGMGKTTYLTQVIVPAARQGGLVPVVVSLADYFDRKQPAEDLPTFVRDKIFGPWHPDSTEKDQFARELAQAARDRRMFWLLDGYDELTPRERGLLNQELERLDRFVLTTRQTKPEARRPIEANLHLHHINRLDALEYVSARYSANARSRIEEWNERQYDAQEMLASGWWLDETAQLANEPSQVLSLTTILEKAISRQLSTRARFHSDTTSDTYALARNALGSIAFESLSPKQRSSADPDRVSRSQLVFAWRSRSPEPEAIFFEVINSTGLLLEADEHWRFPNDWVRDALAAEFIRSEFAIESSLPGIIPLSGAVLYPQYERPISFWIARLMRARQSQRVVDWLSAVRDLPDDPYGARWPLIVRVLTECRPFENDQLRAIRLETEQALLGWQQTTTSNRMKWQINFWLLAIGSDKMSNLSSGALEAALQNLDTDQPQLPLPELMEQAGRQDLARRLANGGRVDQQAVTHALIDIVADGPTALITDAAIHLAQRSLEPTTLEGLRREGPIDRLAELARTHPMNQYVSPQDFKRVRTAQSAALGILGRLSILANESLLKRIPDDVIHSLMADLRLRIRKTDNRITVITADGRDWSITYDDYRA